MKFANVSEILASREDLRHAAEAYLRSKGWDYTSQTPGSYWMFQRDIGGRTVLVDLDTALRIQGHQEAEERYRDAPPSSRRPDADGE